MLDKVAPMHLIEIPRQAHSVAVRNVCVSLYNREF